MQTAPITSEVRNHVTTALQLLESQNLSELSQFIGGLHPVELVAIVNSVEQEKQIAIIKLIPGLDQLAEFLSYSGDHLRMATIPMLDDSRLTAITRRMEIDDAVDVLGTLSRRRQTVILKRITPAKAAVIRSLLAYDEETAGGIMNPHFLSYSSGTTAGEVIVALRSRLQENALARETDISSVYITDEEGRIAGACSLREVLAADPSQKLLAIMSSPIISVAPGEDQEQVARIIQDYDFVCIPVVEPESRKMLGIVTVDDVLDVIQDEHTEDILRLAGTEDDDTVGASIPTAIRSRLPWLMASWVGGICGAALLGQFSGILERVVALAFFMPVVFGMGGNVGSQSATITVRGIATGDLGQHKIKHRLYKESLVGLTLGLTFGCLLGLVAGFHLGDPALGIVIGSSISVTMTCAAALGAMLPVMLLRFGFDPAIASGPFVTTTTDLLSICIYFSTALLLL